MKLHYLVLLGKANLVAKLSRPDLLAGAEYRTSLEWPNISQNTKAIALVFSILECILELHCLVLLGKANLVAILSRPDLLVRAKNRPPL